MATITEREGPTVRILAICDLHVTERQREEDQRAVLARVADDADQLRPALSIIGGDLYGHAVPHRSTPTEREILAPFVQRLARWGPVVVLVGNHDVPEDLELLARLSGEWPIHVVTEPEILRVDTRVGAVDVAALPYPRRKTWLDEGEARGGESTRAVLQAKLAELLAAWSAVLPLRRPDRAATVFAGHVQISGSRTGGGEVLAGGEPEIAPVDLADLPVDVALLGHIHLCQTPADRAWYTGSPWPQDFGEREDKGYLVADVGPWAMEVWDPTLNGGGPPRAEELAAYPATETRNRARILRLPAHAPKLVSLTWRWGCPHGDEEGQPDWLETPNAIPADVRGAHVRARLHVQPQARASCPWEKVSALFRAALSWKEELVIETSVSVRAPEVAAAEALDDKIRAYWRTLTPAPAPELQDAALRDLEALNLSGADEALARISAIRLEA